MWKARASVPRFCGLVLTLVGILGEHRRAHGQISVTPVIEPSPMIAKGHLEGGVNGEGSPRPDGKTPLMLAVEAQLPDVVDYLLKNGADPSLRDAAGETAMDLARRGAMTERFAQKLDDYLSAHPNPAEFYAGRVPVLTIVSGNNQSGAPGCAAPHSLVVAVMDRDGHPLADAPVKFAVEGGGKCLLTAASSPDSPSLLLRTNGEGRCRANVHLPAQPNTRLRITASAGPGDQAPKVVFTAMTNDGTGGESVSCFHPSQIHSQMHRDGSINVTWQNNTDDETCIKIWARSGEGWELMQTLPPHSTSANLPP